jgi:hypothetical protein
VVLVIREALIYLGAGDVRKATTHDAIHGFTILEEADDVVDADACVLDDGVAAAHARLACDVPITDSCRVPVHAFENTPSGFLKPDLDVRDLRLAPGRERVFSNAFLNARSLPPARRVGTPKRSNPRHRA